jgi:hypothetical protein
MVAQKPYLFRPYNLFEVGQPGKVVEGPEADPSTRPHSLTFGLERHVLAAKIVVH